MTLLKMATNLGMLSPGTPPITTDLLKQQMGAGR